MVLISPFPHSVRTFCHNHGSCRQISSCCSFSRWTGDIGPARMEIPSWMPENKVPLNSQPDSPISSHFYSPASDSIAIALNWVTWVEFHTGIRELKGQVTRPDIREGALSETEIREPDALIIIRLPSPVKQALPPDQWGMSWTPPSANQMRVCLKL